jgi:hypothetical protein
MACGDLRVQDCDAMDCGGAEMVSRMCGVAVRLRRV